MTPGALPVSVVLPETPLVSMDRGKMAARRATVTVAMADRPAQLRELKMAAELNVFLRSATGGKRGWETGTPDDVFDLSCFLDTQGNAIKRVHVRARRGCATLRLGSVRLALGV